MSLRKKRKRRKKSSYDTRTSKTFDTRYKTPDWRRRVIHYSSVPNATRPELHDVANYDRPRISSNTEWTSCLICLAKMVKAGILPQTVLEYEERTQRRDNARYRPV